MKIFPLFKVSRNLFPSWNYHGKSRNYHFWFSPVCRDTEKLKRYVTAENRSDKILFSTRKRRQVFAIKNASGSGVIVKKEFLWRHKKNCFHVKDFSYAEVINHSGFTPQTYRIPKLYGYFEKRILGLPVECGLIMEYLPDFRQIRPQEYQQIPAVLADLCQQGYFHGDVNTKNILKCDTTDEFAIIDLQTACKVPEKSLPHLIRMAGCFLYSTAGMFPGDFDAHCKQDFMNILYKIIQQKISPDIPKDVFWNVLDEVSKYTPWKFIPPEKFEINFQSPQEDATGKSMTQGL